MTIRRTVTGLGICIMDYLCIVPRIPLDNKVQAAKTLEQAGGPAATAICTAAKLGAKTAFISAVGDDLRGQAILKQFAEGGVATTGIKQCSGAESAVAFCWVLENTAQRSVVWSYGSVKPLQPEDVDVALVRNSDLLHLDGHHTAAAIHAAKIARDAGTTVMLDAGSMVAGIEEVAALADIVIASEEFAERFTGERDVETALKKLVTQHTKFAAVTLGDKGCLGFDGQTVYRQPSFSVKAVDTTGAGDVFHGAFAYRYLDGGDWQECMYFSSAVAALSCTRFGGRAGIPSLAEVEQFLREIKADD